MLWSATVTKDSPAQVKLPFDLRVTKACIGGKVAPKKRYVLQATYEDPFEGGEPTMATLCSLSETCENASLDIVIDADETVVLATGGSATIYLSGYMILPEMDGDDFDSDDSDSDDSDSDDSGDDEDGVRYVLDALSRAESDSDDSDFEEGEGEGEPKVREITSSDEDSDDDEESDDDDDVDMDDEESSGDSVVFEEQEDSVSASILKKIQEKAARIQQEQKKASSPAVGKKRRASSEPTESAPAQQKMQRVATPTKKAASPTAKSPAAKSPAVKSATHRNQEEKKNKSPLRKTLPGGLVIETVKQGSGKVAQKGKQVTVKYTGKLANGKKFDSGTFAFRVGTRQVIQGWDMGVPGMKVGEQRKLIIPPKLAYGKKGAGRDIPPNSTLHFDVELLRC